MSLQPIPFPKQHEVNYSKPLENIAKLVRSIRSHYQTFSPPSVNWRSEQLMALQAMLKDKNSEILAALQQDLQRSNMESFLAETGLLHEEINYALKNLKKWCQTTPVATPLSLMPGKSSIVWEPLGIALIIGAWNYPLQLTLAPLIPCIAAGNAAIIKPSELAPATSQVIAQQLHNYLDSKAFIVVEGGIQETTALLEQKFDKIFFTGSTQIGQIVMAAAAKNLTPVTLELGGKCPCIVDASANLKVAARRITFGKFTNAGQTCVAPDYVLAHSSIAEKLIELIKVNIEKFYGSDPKDSKFYSRIINERHHERLISLLKDGKIVSGGQYEVKERYIAPTIIRDVDPSQPLMTEEIFGPLLPVLNISSAEEAIQFTSHRAKPLAYYLFAEDDIVIEKFKSQASAGGMCINDAMVHLAVPGLPFGGVGPSGMGKYHGEWGFKTFSNAKAVLEHSAKIDPSFRYPPYGKIKEKLLKTLFGRS